MFPYRRGNKKRGKGGSGSGGGGIPPRRHRDGGNAGQGRRIPNSAHELLPLLQPTTKALAQVLAGNTKASGQLVHARNILVQAQRFIDERSVERLIPAQREEFFEQVARLKLTLADADAAQVEEEAIEQAPKPPQAPPVSLEKLRALALSLATPVEAAPPLHGAAEEEAEDEPQPALLAAEEEALAAPTRFESPRLDIKEGSPRSARLRLKSDPGAAKARENRP